MALSDAQHSCGSALYHADAPPAPQTWVEIVRVIDITMNGITVTATDVTHLKSLYCAKEFVPGNIDGGDVSFTLNFQATQLSTVMGLVRQYRSWRILTPNGSSMDFEGFLTNIGMQIPNDDRITVPAAFKVSGLPVFTIIAVL